MIILMVLSTVIILAVSFSAMDYVVRGCASLTNKTMRNFAFTVATNPLFTISLNVIVSYLIMAFTGAGAIAGLANLGSSVIAGLFGPMYMRRRFASFADGDEKQKPVAASRVWTWLKAFRSSIEAWTYKF